MYTDQVDSGIIGGVIGGVIGVVVAIIVIVIVITIWIMILVSYLSYDWKNLMYICNTNILYAQKINTQFYKYYLPVSTSANKFVGFLFTI